MTCSRATRSVPRTTRPAKSDRAPRTTPATGDSRDDIADTVTPREYDVLRLVATGHTNGEIDARLGLSDNTVKSYSRTVMQKLQARNRAQAVADARRHGLL